MSKETPAQTKAFHTTGVLLAPIWTLCYLSVNSQNNSFAARMIYRTSVPE